MLGTPGFMFGSFWAPCNNILLRVQPCLSNKICDVDVTVVYGEVVHFDFVQENSSGLCDSRKYPYSPHGRFLICTPSPPGNSSSASYFAFNCLLLRLHPPPPPQLGISNNLPWVGYVDFSGTACTLNKDGNIHLNSFF